MDKVFILPRQAQTFTISCKKCGQPGRLQTEPLPGEQDGWMLVIFCVQCGAGERVIQHER